MTWTLVTGGAQRLGANICCELAEKGYSILVHYRTHEREAEEIVRKCKSFGVQAEKIQGDFSTQESTDQFIAKVQSKFEIANLINNVGQYLVEPATKTTSQEWQNLLQVNFLAPVALIQAFLPTIKSAKGNVINIGVSGLNTLRANTTFPAYFSTKANLLLLTKSLAKELAQYGVRVNMVSPGILKNSEKMPDSPDIIPMGRFGELHEISHVVAFLLDPRSQYITGQNIEVAGGLGL